MPTSDSQKLDMLDRLAEEFVGRYRKGERPSLAEYVERHPELADDIRELFPALVQVEQAEEQLREPAPPLAGPPLRVGDYRVLREVGRGGMGVVYEAEQLSLGRRVALKVLPQSVARDDRALERFRREARAAAKLHHTNIVPVFEVGQGGETCFYAMQFIQGQPLDEVIEELKRLRQASGAGQSACPPGPRQVAQSLLTGRFRAEELTTPATTPETEPPRAGGPAGAGPARLPDQTDISAVEANRQPFYRSVASVGRQVADALAYAHARGVIHRDIKPSNLLLDSAGVVWVTDFGLAKTEDEGLTNTGDILGTFRYMSPERFRGECDARADVYSLGLTLYELLTLRPAFEARDRARLTEQIQNAEPPRPRSLDPGIPRDLETVVLKAIDKEPDRRYQSAEEMGRDLQRFLADEPVHARRVSVAERGLRWLRRRPVVAGLASAVALLVLLVAIVSTVAAVWLKAALRTAEAANANANDELWGSKLTEARALRMSRQPGQRFASLRAIQEALKLPLPAGRSRDELRTEAIAALLLPDLEVTKEWDGWPAGTHSFAIDDAFQQYARGDNDGNVSVRRVEDDGQLFALPGGGRPLNDYLGLVFSPDGRFLHQFWAGAQGFHGRLWRLDGSGPVAVLDDDHGNVAFRPDSRQAAFSCADGAVRFVDTETGKEVRRFPSGSALPQCYVCWNPRLPQLVVQTADGWRVIDAETGQVVQERRQPGGVSWLDWHPEGRLLAVCAGDQRIYLWDVTTGKLIRPPLEGHKGGGVTARFSHAGDRLVSDDWSGSLRLWDVRTGRQILARAANCTWLRFSPDDGLLAGDVDLPRVRLFRFWPGDEFRTLVHQTAAGPGSYQGLFEDHVREGLAAVAASSGVALVDVARGEEVAVLPLEGNVPVRFEPSLAAVWTSGRDGLLRWPVQADPAERRGLRVGPPQALSRLSADLTWWRSNADGDVLAIPNFNRGALLWQRGPNRFLTLGPQDDVRACAVSSDGRWVATGSHGLRQGAAAQVWDARSGEHLADLPVEPMCGVGFSPNDRWLITTGGRFRLWEVGTWREGPALGGSSHNTAFAFSPDGGLLALGDAPGVIRLVSPETGREVARLTAPEPTRLKPGGFTAGGTKLIASGDDTRALYGFDLAAIRAQLKEIGLDWDAPELPPSAAPAAEPLRVRVEMGDFLQRSRADQLYAQARQHLRDNRYPAAVAALRQAVQTDPGHAEAHNSLAWILLTGPKELRDPKAALPLARRAVELVAEEPSYHNTLGLALYRNEAYREAVAELEKSLSSGSRSVPAYDLLFLAMCHHRLGDVARAQDCRERAGRWFEEHRGKLAPGQVADLTEFQAEADSVLREPPGDKREER